MKTKTAAVTLTALALSTLVGCTQITEYTGEMDCSGSEQDAWLLLETTLGSDEPTGWFGLNGAQDSRDTWAAGRLEDTRLEGSELRFEVDFNQSTGNSDVVLDATDDGGWEGEIELGAAADCDLTLDLES
jgi:hypothetical protein